MQHRLVSRNSMRERTSKAFFAKGLFETAVDVTHSFSTSLLFYQLKHFFINSTFFFFKFRIRNSNSKFEVAAQAHTRPNPK
jgi:hypothetical protein